MVVNTVKRGMPRHIIVTSVQGRNREQGKNAEVGILVSGRICISWGGWIGCSQRGRTVEKFKVWFVLQLVLEILIVTTGFLVLTARGATSSLVKLGNDWLDDVLHLLLLGLEVLGLSLGVLLQPRDLLVHDLLDLLLLLVTELASELLLVRQLVLQAVCIALELIPGLNTSLQLGVLVGKLFGVVDHPLDVLRGQPVLVVGAM